MLQDPKFELLVARLFDHEVESSKDDIAVVNNVGGDLNVAHGGDGSRGADGDGEADGAFGATKNLTVECINVDIGAVHEADAAPVELAAPPIPHSAQSAANVAPGGRWKETPRSVSPVTAELGLEQERRASSSRQRPAKPQSSPTVCFGPETLVRVATACTPGDWTRKKIKHITPDDHVLGWFQENATTVVRKKVRVLCVMAFKQPVTNRVPLALTLLEGAAITPMHHDYVDGVWLQAREVAARAVRATGAPVLEVLAGDLTARYQFPLGYSTRWVCNLVLCQPGNFQLENGLWVASLGYKMCPESSSPSQDSSQSMVPWALFYSKARFSFLKKLAGPGSGMTR